MADRETQLQQVIGLIQSSRPDEAAAILDNLLAADPRDAEACYLRGFLHLAGGKAQAAVPLFDRAAPGKQTDPFYHQNFARALLGSGDVARAEVEARQFHTARPDIPDASSLLARCLRLLGREAEALPLLAHAAAVSSAMAEVNELGLCLLELDRPAEAADAFRQAAELAADRFQPWHNLGNALLDQHQPEAAIAAFDRALALAPEDAASRVHRAQALLLLGRYAEGFVEYEWRWRLPATLTLRGGLTTPLWDGAPLAGRRLLLYAEQGFGDTLQFARFVPMAAQRGGRIILDVPPALHRLLSGLPGAAQVSRQDAPAPDHDLRLPLMSLPHALGVTVETLPAAPYLPVPDPGPWAGRLAHLSGRKVGLAWKALAEKRGSALRSAPLAALSPLFALPGISWISLQKDVPAEDRPLPPHMPDVSGHLGDFADTAALIAGLDLVVTVDTAVAHLAGAMGKPVWVMLPAGCDWRWLMAREDSPWYPTARLFRLTREAGWAGIAAALTRALTA